MNAELCIICQEESVEPLINVRQKGLQTLINYCETRKCKDLQKYLREQLHQEKSYVKVHKDCRRDFTNPLRKQESREYENVDVESSPSTLRSANKENFDWKSNCFLCGKHLIVDKKHPDRNKEIFKVGELESMNTIQKKILERNDEWALEVSRRLSLCIDLVASDAEYHKQCKTYFLCNKMPPRAKKEASVQGRPVEEAKENAFYELCSWLDEQTELFTVTELHEKLCSISKSPDNYSLKWLKKRLQEYYKENIFFSTVKGRSNTVGFKDMVSGIINDKWYLSRCENLMDEKTRIISAAAKLIKSEVRSSTFDTEFYPTLKDLDSGTDILPPSLRLLMESLISSELRQASIGQCILKAMKPNSVIPPLLFGLGVEVDHAIGSKTLLIELAKLGYSISYDEVKCFKYSLMSSDTNNLASMLASMSSEFTQFVADIVDHNVCSLDGRGTFHRMGIIACSSSIPNIEAKRTRRLTKILKSKELSKKVSIDIKWYDEKESKALTKLRLAFIKELKSKLQETGSQLSVELLWHTASIFGGAERQRKRSGWNCFMENISAACPYPEKSTVTMLPLIDLNPSDMSCIYSTLLHVIDLAFKLKIPTASITFDQPLWIKAIEIVQSKKLNIVVRLGSFHCLMSFIGSIGMCMEGSGLEKLLEQVYSGKNVVSQMLSGKAISRALRGLFLVDSAIQMILFKMLLEENKETKESSASKITELGASIPTPHEESVIDANEQDLNNKSFEDQTQRNFGVDFGEIEYLTKQEIEEMTNMYEKLNNTDFLSNEFDNNQVIIKVARKLDNLKAFLCKTSQTGRLWLQFSNYVCIAKEFIRAERSGDWHGHLAALGKMLSLFAATGHINYAKSGRLYLQLMVDLEKDFPWLYQQFEEKKFHTVRRTNKFWAGLWTDLTIEQTMMRSIKSLGGLTRGRGIDESTRNIWISTLHDCATIEQCMRKVTNTVRETSEQHVELGKSRCLRDNEDLHKLYDWLKQFNPFDVQDSRLRSLKSGLVAKESDQINCHYAEDVGLEIMLSMDNKTVAEAKVETSKKVKTLITLIKGCEVGNQTVHVDPTVLFLRLIVLVERLEDTSQCFSYELASIATSLFKDNYMRHVDKSLLADALINYQQNKLEKQKK